MKRFRVEKYVENFEDSSLDIKMKTPKFGFIKMLAKVGIISKNDFDHSEDDSSNYAKNRLNILP